MATTTDHIVAKDVAISLASQDIQGSSIAVTLQPEMDTAAFSVFGDDWEYSLMTTKRWSGEIRVAYTETASEGAEELFTAYEGGVSVALQVDPKGDTASNWRFSGSVLITGVPVELDRSGGIVTIAAPFVGTGALTKGTVPA